MTYEIAIRYKYFLMIKGETTHRQAGKLTLNSLDIYKNSRRTDPRYDWSEKNDTMLKNLITKPVKYLHETWYTESPCKQ